MYLLDIYQKDLEIWMISIRLIQSLSLTSLFYGLEYASYQELRDCERSRDSGFVEKKIFMYLFFYFIIPAWDTRLPELISKVHKQHLLNMQYTQKN